MDRMINYSIIKRPTLALWSMILILVVSCARGPEPGKPEKDLPDGPVTEDLLWEHLSYLAGDSLSGRLAGSPHELQAAKYIRREFLRYGLTPAVPEFFQPFLFLRR